MQTSVRSWSLMILMVIAATVAWVTHPTILLANLRPAVDLGQLVPKQFGAWRELQQSTGQIINPQQSLMIRKIYSQTLSRTYQNAEGSIVMLSIAYGANESDGMILHYPEACYPAQGFQVLSDQKSKLQTAFGSIPVKRLSTKLGNRSEPLTYWSTLGDKVVYRGLGTKLAQLSYGFRGQIPDGLIFRLSSISNDVEKAHELQATFARDLLAAIPAESRLRLAGV